MIQMGVHSFPRNADRPYRRGFTLLELMLVLTLLVIVCALALPAWEGPLANHRLRKAADVVRTEWARARIQAMKTGRTHVFVCRVGGQACAVRPWSAAEDQAEADLDQPADLAPFSASDAGRPADPTASRDEGRDKLPKRVIFSEDVQVADDRAAAMMPPPAGDLSLESGGSTGWSQPIFFYPDGTTSSASLTLANERGRAVRVRLRGLTGAARASRVYSERVKKSS